MSQTAPVSTKTLLGHPIGLYFLFFTEMWERFSYYGMRALLIFYMTKQLLLPHAQASNVYGLYTGLVYFTPFFGGILADRYLGQRRCVIIGGILMAIGHFLMAFENLFYPALGFLILGNGAFKPNISTQVGALYPDGDPRRDSAFSIFYVGINLGAFLAPLICGTLGEIYGWHYGFGAAGIGMIVGLCVYVAGQRFMPQSSREAARSRVTQDVPAAPLTSTEKDRIKGLVAICAVVVVFWAVFEQQGNTMAMWADNDTDRHIFGWEIPATWFVAINPFLIFTLTPFITSFWSWQARRGKEPTSAGKIAIGMAFSALAFLFMTYPASIYAVDGTPVSMFWIVGFYFLLTLGELYLSPVGLSLVTKLAPVSMTSMFMGVWFLGQFAGNYCAGFLGGFYDSMQGPPFFALLAGLAAATALGVGLMLRPLKRSLA